MKKFLAISIFCLISSFSPAQEISGANWSCLGPFKMKTQNIGFISSFWTDYPNGNTALAGSLNGGLWKGTYCSLDTCSGSFYWTNITDSYNMPGVGINAIEVVPNTNAQTIYIATQLGGNGRYFGYSQGILKTSDGGKRWKQVGPSIKIRDYKTVNYLKMNFENSNCMIAEISKKLYYTSDGWNTFRELESPIKNKDSKVEIGDVEWKPGDQKTFYLTTRSEAGIKSEFYVTHDEGKTFQNMKPEIVASNIQLDVWRKPGKENFLFMAYGDPSMSVQFFDGTKWSGKKNKNPVSHWAGSPYWNMEFDVNDLDTSIMYLSTTQLSRSTDGGKTFTTVTEYWGQSTHADIRDMKILRSTPGGMQDMIGLGNDGGFSVSVPDEKGIPQWINMNGEGLCIAQLWGLGTSETEPNYIVGGGQDNGIYSFRDNEWRAQANGVGDGYDAVIAESNTSYSIGQGNSPSLVMSVDGGLSWSGTQTVAGPANIFRRPMYYDKENNTVWLAHHQLWMKDNTSGKFDARWKQKSFIPDYKGKNGVQMNSLITCFAVGGKNNSVGIMAFNGPLWGNDSIQGKVFYTNTLNTEKPEWIDISRFMRMLDWREIQDVMIDVNDDSRFYVNWFGPYSGFDRELLQLDVFDGGDSIALTDISYDLPKFPGSKFVMEKSKTGNIYFATDTGVYFTNYELLKKNHWEMYQSIEHPLPFCNISDMEINYASNSLIISTYGRGVWKTPLAETGMDKSITIKKSTIWDKRKKLDGELTVNSGKTLTISAEIYISNKAKITLKKGAKIVINQTSRNFILKDFSGRNFDLNKIRKYKNAKVEMRSK